MLLEREPLRARPEYECRFPLGSLHVFSSVGYCEANADDDLDEFDDDDFDDEFDDDFEEDVDDDFDRELEEEFSEDDFEELEEGKEPTLPGFPPEEEEPEE